MSVVTGNYIVGGLVGSGYSAINKCYATGPVTGETSVGGLVGMFGSGVVNECYSAGFVTGGTFVGGLVGRNDSSIVSNSYWDLETSGQTVSAGGTGTNTAAIKQPTTFLGWDFVNTWGMTEGTTYPFFMVAATSPSGDGTAGNPYQISQLGHLVWMGDNVGSSSGKYYSVKNDMDASATAGWNGGKGFEPIGSGYYTPFMGVFNGNGRAIRSLIINRPDQDNIGLFGYVGKSGSVNGIGVAGGAVVGSNMVGGLVGWNKGSVSGCYARASVMGSNEVGGLIGGNGSGGFVSDSFAAGPVMGRDWWAGGFMGVNDRGMVHRCYAIGPVTGGSEVGGFVGANFAWVFGGGLSNCYATGSVTGSYYGVGGLVGQNGDPDDPGIVDRCFSTGRVDGGGTSGGLVGGDLCGTVTASYWDMQTSGQVTSVGGTGKTTAQMKQQATFAGWDFSGLWHIIENVTCPYLSLSIGQQPYTATYSPWLAADGVEFENFDRGGNGVAYGDTTATNQGGAYRTGEGVDIATDAAASNGFTVGWTLAGEWMEYTAQVPEDGTYDLEIRVANAGAGATCRMLVDGANVTGSLSIPNTGAWNAYLVARKAGLQLKAGAYVFRFEMDAASSAGFVGAFDRWRLVSAGPLFGFSQALAPSGTSRILGWDLYTNRVRIQHRPSLTTGEWAPVTGWITGQQYAVPASGMGTSGFYRIEYQP